MKGGSPTAAGKAAWVGTIIGVTSLAGFVREILLARQFGTGAAADTWAVAAAVFGILTELFMLGGPIAAAAVPILTDRRVASAPDGERRAFAAMVAGSAITLVAVGAAAVPGAGIVATAFAPGFSGARRALLVMLLVYVGLAILPLGLSGVLASGSISRSRFTAPALHGLAIHVAVIASLLVLAPRIGPTALGIGLLAGALAQLALQLQALRTPGVRLPPDWSVLPEVLALAAPAAAIFLLGEGTLILSRVFASTLATGQASALYYSAKLEQLPLGIFGSAVALVAFPMFAELAAREEPAALGSAIAKSMRVVVLLSVPSAAGLTILATPIVRLLFERGAFGPASTAMTSAVLVVYAAGLVGQAALPSLLRAYFALKEMRTPALVLATVLLVNVVLDVALLRFGAVGLGAAFSATMTLGAVALAVRLDRRVRFWPEMRMAGLLALVSGATLALCAAAVLAHGAVDSLVGHASLAARAAGALSAILAGTGAYALVVRAARVPEFDDLVAAVASRVKATSRRPVG